MNRLFDKAQPYLFLLGRILISAIFILSGISKMGSFAGTAQMMGGKGLPAPEVLLALTILIEAAGGLMLLLGIYARLTALVYFVWLIPVTLVFHRFWGIDPAQVQGQYINFMKNLAIMGGMATIMAAGSGPLSVTKER
ncbi:MAG TPA: DoxX family protein [bacterium]